MGSRVELFEQIRRDRDREDLSIRALAERHGVHRRAVRQALASPLPLPRKRPEDRPAPKLGAYRELIDDWLKADRGAPRKQRHTARRVWERLSEEHGVKVSERAVRKWVAARKRELGGPPAGMVPLMHDPGVEAEVDWGESVVILRGQPRKVFIFHMRACHSGGAFAMAFPRETQQAFLEAHVHAFQWFGGVFELIRYDNLKAAVQKVLKGRRRVESDRFVALRSHYLFESSFCLPGQEGAHEKGGVEGEVGRFRRRHLVPLPEVQSLSELNELIAAGCIGDLKRTIRGHAETVSEALSAEMARLRALPSESFDAREQATPRVDSKALVTVRQNRYSVPVALVGRKVLVKIGAREVEIFQSTTWSPATSGCRATSAWPGSSTTTWSCSSASPAHCAPRSRCARSASGAPGHPASMSCGLRSKRAMAPQRPPGRWSTCCCSAASSPQRASSSPSVAPWPPALVTGALSRSLRGALSAQRLP